MNSKTLPAVPSFDTYGGEKRDYIALVNPASDRTADQINSAFYDLAMIARIAPKFIVEVSGSGGLIDYNGCVVSKIPFVEPTVTLLSAGTYSIAFPERIPNAFGEMVDFTYQFATCSGSRLIDPFILSAERHHSGNPYEVIVKSWSHAGVLSDVNGNFTLVVY